MYISLSKNPASNGDTITAWAGDCPSSSFYISWSNGTTVNPTSYNCTNYGSTQTYITITATVTDVNHNYIAGGTASATLYIDPSVTADTTPPTINWVGTGYLSGYSTYEMGYRVTASVSDPSGVSSVQFPTWSDINGQDDIIWGTGVNDGGGLWHYDVYKSAHGNNTGLYATHVYATDGMGNRNTVYNCGGTTVTIPTPTIHVTGVTTTTPVTITQNVATQLYASVVPSNANINTLSWFTSSGTITQAGVVTIPTVGEYTVTVVTTEGNFYGYITVNVVSATVPVTGVTVTSPVTVTQGVPTQLYASVTPSNATDKRLYWYTNSGTITQDGILTVSALGGCTVSVSSWNGAYTSNIAVTSVAPYVYVTGINVTTPVTVTQGVPTQLYASVVPSNANDQRITWSTSSGTITQAGVLTSNIVGSLTVYATTTEGGYQKAISVTSVSATIPVTGLNVTTPVTVTRNVPTQLYASVVPSNATDQRLYWSTNSGSITQDGILTVSALGDCTVTVSSWNGAYTKNIAVKSISGVGRPSNWTWSSVSQNGYINKTVLSGSSIIAYIMTAKEWSDTTNKTGFTDRINAFRDYKNLDAYPFTIPVSGSDFTYTYINDAINAINGMGFNLASSYSGQTISASIFTTMSNILNSIN